MVSRWDALAAHQAGAWARAAELWRAVAAAGDEAGDALYQAACCQERAGDRAGALATLELSVATVAAWEGGLGAPALRRELLALAAEDQAARRAWLDDEAAAEEHLRAVDARSSACLRAIVAALGWPGRTLVGRDGAWAAWLLAQHADEDRDLQRRCLVEMERAVARGEADPQELAYLSDRVAVAEGRPQLHGTQLDDRLEPHPIEAPEKVDERRHAAGLGPLADYLRWVRAER